MHDLDRTYLEDDEGLELGADGEYGDHEDEGDGADEDGEDEDGDDEAAHGAADDHGEHREGEAHDGGEVFHEDEVTELAAELLGVSSEQELDHFLGNFLKRARDLAGSFLSSAQGKALGGILKGIAPKVVPWLANAIAPGLGGPIAGALGLELEGLSPEDREFESAKQYIRLGAEAVKQAAAAPQSADAREVADAAMTRAAQQFAPGLLPGTALASHAHSGRWVRRGRHIILHGVF